MKFATRFPITLATFPLMFSTPEHSLQASLIFDVVFFIVVISAVVQGTSLTPVARWLGLEQPREPEPPVTLEISSLRRVVESKVVDFTITPDSKAAGRLVKDLALPTGVVIAMIVREEKVIPPQGLTRILAGDHVILVLGSGTEPLVDKVFGKIQEEPGAVPTEMEFPFRGSTTVAELEEFYGIHVDAPKETTLDEVIRIKLEPDQIKVDAVVEVSSLRFTIRKISSNGHIELLGMSILEPDEPGSSEGAE